MPDRVLIVDDDEKQATMLQSVLEAENYSAEVETSSARALNRLRKSDFDVVLSDLRMPDLSGYELYMKVRRFKPQQLFMIMTAFGSIERAVDAVRAGVFDFIQKPVNSKQLLTVLNRAREFRFLRKENLELRVKVKQSYHKDSIIGDSDLMSQLLEEAEMAACSDATVLIRGESGTGKELIANHIHYQSPRADGPFVKVNCGAIPETLLEDELFGHVKGAFTGAERAREGRFERSNGGTIFLDEVSEMPPQLQVKLLRVLQEREFERVGSTETIPVDIRVILATNQKLEELVEKGEFREDLYYRVNVIPLALPPLRERVEDIPLLANHFLQRSARKNNRQIRRITDEASRLLLGYQWPGNVRELENCIERAVVMNHGDEITPQDLSFFRVSGRRLDQGAVFDRLFSLRLTLDDVEREFIQKGLEQAEGNQSKAAKLLGVSRRTLQDRAEKHGLLKGSQEESGHTESEGG